MARSEVLRDDEAIRRKAQLLADQIFRPRPKSLSRIAKRIQPTKRFNRRQAEELAAEILGHKRDFKTERREKRRRSRLAKKRRQERQRDREGETRCWDWIFHSENVHYARNGSAFTTYTPLSPENSHSLRLGPQGALGIGTVNLVAPRSFGAPDMCTITLYDVLHMPHMPCNGISIQRMVQAGTEVLLGDGRLVVTHGPRGHLLLEGRQLKGSFPHRLCLAGEAEGVVRDMQDAMSSPLPSGIIVDEKEIERVGRSTRELRDEQCAANVVSGEICGVEC